MDAGVRGGGAESRGATPDEQLLAIFDIFDEWFRREDFEACSFINVLLEMGTASGREGECAAPRERQLDRSPPRRGGRLASPASFARSWHILMKGSIVSAAEGDADAAHRAQSIGRLLIDEYR